MSKAARRLASSISFNMTPMIDIVFLLIIFFMTASALTSLQSVREVELPEAREARSPRRVPPNRITVTVVPSGAYVVTGEELDLAGLRRVLQTEARVARVAGQPPPAVLLRADRNARYRALRLVMRECVALGMRDLGFAVTPPAEEEK